MQESDAELVIKARAGERSAFGVLLARHIDVAMRLATRMVGEEYAREMVQEGALQAMLSLDRLGEAASFGPWFCGIVLNLCRGQLRQRRREVSWEDFCGGRHVEHPLLVDPEPSPAEQFEAQQMHQLVLVAVAELSPKVRRAALLFYFEQLSLKEIAALLHISVGAVKGRLFKARQELADTLWPLYAELREIDEREPEMTKVEIADVIAFRGDQSFLVVLLDRNGKRKLHIMIGHAEGSALSMFLRGLSLPRPVTAQFTANILDALDAELSQVRVEKLEETVFYAVAVVRSGDQVKELDARPSDAMCVAAIKGAPIYVTDEVWQQGGQECSDEEIAQMGQSLQVQSVELANQIAKMPTVHRVESEIPAAGEFARLEVARQRMQEGELSDLGPGDELRFPMESSWLYIGDVPRFCGMPANVDGYVGLSVFGPFAAEEQPAAAADGKKNVVVELGRGWLQWQEDTSMAESYVQFPRKLDEPAEIRIDGELWATATLHTGSKGYALKIVALS